MKKYSLEGRIFLPPDCETVGHLVFKFHRFHREEALAVHKGKEHVERHLKLAKDSLETLKLLR